MLPLDENGVKAPLTVAFLLSSLANLILLNNSKTSCSSAIVKLALYPPYEAPMPPHRPPQPRRGANRSDTDQIVVKSYAYPFLFSKYGSDIRRICIDMDQMNTQLRGMD